MSCNKCSKSHSGVEAFMLSCCVCNSKWHHRCHAPPVTDSELILRIKAHNVGDSANGLKAWKCNRCARSGFGSRTPSLNPPLPHSFAPSPTVVHDSKNYDDAIIVVDDSDMDSDPPPSNLISSQSKRASAGTHPQLPATVGSNLQPSTSAPLVARGKVAHRHPFSSNDHSAIHPQPTPPSSLSRQHLAQPMTITTDDDEIVVIHPSQFPNNETKRNQFRRDAKNREINKRMEHKQRQQQLLKVKIEAKGAALNLDTGFQEPTPRPQTPEVAGSVGNLPVTFVGPSAAKEANLAPQWFDDDANDIWARALRVRKSKPPSRRKIQGRKLDEARPQIFNFDIMQWRNRMNRIQG